MKVRFYDLGANPTLTLLGASLLFGVVWAIAYWVENKEIPVISFIASVFVHVCRVGCIGALISIPLNLFLGFLY